MNSGPKLQLVPFSLPLVFRLPIHISMQIRSFLNNLKCVIHVKFSLSGWTGVSNSSVNLLIASRSLIPLAFLFSCHFHFLVIFEQQKSPDLIRLESLFKFCIKSFLLGSFAAAKNYPFVLSACLFLQFCFSVPKYKSVVHKPWDSSTEWNKA